MNEVLDRIAEYWGKRSDGYCLTNLQEMNSFKKQAWIDLISENAPLIAEEKRKVLDIGTGPGFFALIMASLGHEVTAVDYTEAMIEKAKRNAEMFNQEIQFLRMDAHKLDFNDDTFDLIMTRNLTWNLERPAEAYQDWYRVLKQGGALLNFDANWYLYLYNEEIRKENEKDRLNFERIKKDDSFDHNIDLKKVDPTIMESIARGLPLSKMSRPEWDFTQLFRIGFKKVMVDREVGSRVWSEEEFIKYRSMPMFMIRGEK